MPSCRHLAHGIPYKNTLSSPDKWLAASGWHSMRLEDDQGRSAGWLLSSNSARLVAVAASTGQLLWHGSGVLFGVEPDTVAAAIDADQVCSLGTAASVEL